MTDPNISLHANLAGPMSRLFTYADRRPIGEVNLGPIFVNVYSPAQAREIAAAFTQLADEFQAYEDAHCPECFAETPAGDPSPAHSDMCSRDAS